MNRPLPSSTASCTSCGRVELHGAPILASLIGVALVSTPVCLWASERAHALLATTVLATIGAATIRPLRALVQPWSDGVGALRFDGAGSFWLEAMDGTLRPVQVHGSSVIRGPWLVLRVSSGATIRRLVVEQSSAQASELAALRRALRRLAAGPRGPRHALRSLLEKGDPAP